MKKNFVIRWHINSLHILTRWFDIGLYPLAFINYRDHWQKPRIYRFNDSTIYAIDCGPVGIDIHN